MKFLVVGAGAIGGYFGGRLLEKGVDVTFLVREKRRQQLEEHGLVIKSIHGDGELIPKVISEGESSGPFDVILFSTKSYHLEGAIQSVRPFVDSHTMILPLLNGISHVDRLVKEFGEENVIGGLCFIEATLDTNGIVMQTSPMHELVFGERNGEKTERILELQKTISGTKTNFRLSENISQEMWHKYMFITGLSGITTLMRAPIGPIRDAGGLTALKLLFAEQGAIMRKIKAPIADQIEEGLLEKVNQMGYEMKSSMQRDMEKGLSVEADHLQGYLLEIAEKEGIYAPILETIYTNLKVYESMLESQ
ncbi:2-dehydropantoate 2-reductase [Bacillus sp. M6-12]|uniref:ketopantoate reductase family protein n=1 Tax=Bacillus sp. M6-12 TaxID=2054166 RepID=UPI000C7836F9|nr:ketopantoate reductase family protein [Bacillus sp. M6-12]PLS18312.1 2-dehydropantoate 2-reductase [Bacillus sp. M6-12]